MTGIYKITNLTNNKCYIGQSVHIEQRWKDHIRCMSDSRRDAYNRPLYKAFRKYGIDNFSFEILEECTEDKLNEREQYWILFYHSIDKQYGYNLILSNQTANHSNKIVKQYSLNGEYITSYNSTREAERATGVDHTLIGRCCNHKTQHAGNFQWCYNDDEINNRQAITHKVNIGQYDLDGKLIRTFDSIKEAASAFNVKPQSISSALKHGYKSCGCSWKRL